MRLPGTIPPQKPTSTFSSPRVAARFLASPAAVTHMDVGVDQGRHHNQIADVFDRRSDVGVAVEDVDDVAVFDHD